MNAMVFQIRFFYGPFTQPSWTWQAYETCNDGFQEERPSRAVSASSNLVSSLYTSCALPRIHSKSSESRQVFAPERKWIIFQALKISVAFTVSFRDEFNSVYKNEINKLFWGWAAQPSCFFWYRKFSRSQYEDRPRSEVYVQLFKLFDLAPLPFEITSKWRPKSPPINLLPPKMATVLEK